MEFTDALRGITGALEQTFSPQTYLKKQQLLADQKRQFAESLQQSIQSGAIDPDTGNQALAKLGLPPTNINPQTQALTEERKAQTAKLQEAELEKQQQLQNQQTLGQLPDFLRSEAKPEDFTRLMQSGALQLGTPAQKETALKEMTTPEKVKTENLGWEVKEVTGNDGKPQLVRINKNTGQVAPISGVSPKASPYGAMMGKGGAGLDFAVDMAIAGDSSFSSGWARSPQLRMQYLERLAERASEKGLSPKDVAAATAEFQGFKAGEKTLGTRQAQIDLASTVLEQFVPIANAASADYKRSGVRTLNDLQNAVNKRTASPELRKLNASVNAVINAYSRAINPTGVGTVSDKEHAREILDAAFSEGDFEAATSQLMMEIGAEKKAPGFVKTEMRKFFTGDNKQTSTKTVHWDDLK